MSKPAKRPPKAVLTTERDDVILVGAVPHYVQLDVTGYERREIFLLAPKEARALAALLTEAAAAAKKAKPQ